MSESSSSSDEEVNERLRSAVWDVKQSQRSSKVEVKETEDTRKQSKKLPPSLRPSKSNTDFSDDVGVVQASPELKSFVAKRLTKYLDGVITEYAPDEKKTSSTECKDDFKLFSTSKYYDPADETASKIKTNQQKNKRRKRDSTSDSSSDSDEDRQKLASVAVSISDVIHAQSILSAVEETKPAEVIIANKSITNNNSRNVDNKVDDFSKKKAKKKKRKQEKSQLEISDNIAKNSFTNNNSRNVDSKPDELSKERTKKMKKQEKSQLEISDDEKCRIPIKENGNISTLAVKKQKKKKKKHKSDNDS